MHARVPCARVKISTRIFGLPMVNQVFSREITTSGFINYYIGGGGGGGAKLFSRRTNFSREPPLKLGFKKIFPDK
jgi:hypothetical protein